MSLNELDAYFAWCFFFQSTNTGKPLVARITNTGALLQIKKNNNNKVRRVHPWTVKSGTSPSSQQGRSIVLYFLPRQITLLTSSCEIFSQPMFLWPLRSGIYFVFWPFWDDLIFPAARDEAVLNRNRPLAPLISYSTIEPQDRSIQHLSAKRNPQENAGTEAQGAKTAEQNKGYNALQVETLRYGSIPLLKPART